MSNLFGPSDEPRQAEPGRRVHAARGLAEGLPAPDTPMFSPDWYARLAKRLEPVLERLPGVRAVACAQYVFTARRDNGPRPG